MHESLHGLIPGLQGGTTELYIAVGIVGATVMPHVIYLHSALTKGRMPTRNDARKSACCASSDSTCTSRSGSPGLVNLAMLAVAAKLFHTPALSGLSTIPQAHAQFGHLVGGTAAIAFAVALLASGASSSSVGTYAGQVVMGGFINRKIPLFLRRGLTMIPALVVIAVGTNPTSALVLSQVVLSFGIPLALIPLVMLTSRRDIMGVHVNGRILKISAWTIAAAISAMNIFLIYQQFFMS